MSCLTAESIERYALGELGDEARAAADRHLASCDQCQRQLADIRSNVRLVEQIARARAAAGGAEVGDPANDAETITLTWLNEPGPDATGREWPTIPRQFGSVRLIRAIGRGAMGVVYLGHDRMLRRDVAVKFLLGAVACDDDPDFVRFLEGARAAAAVRHPNLTVVYQADRIADVPYLVMEYIDGPTLADVLQRGGPLGAPIAVHVLEAVAAAVGKLHERGIVHRDLKPSNVLLDADGGIYVTDFGLSVMRPRRSGLQTATPLDPSTPQPLDPSQGGLQTATPLDPSAPEPLDPSEPAPWAGTPPYMAPEMFDGEVSPRTDIYALGIMAFELLTGARPFAGTLDDVERQHRQTPLPQEVLKQHGVPDDLIDVLARATHKNAMFRQKSAELLTRALRSASPAGGSANAAADLSNYLSRIRGPVALPESPPPKSSSYYDQLATRAEQKRETRMEISGSPGVAEAAIRADAVAPPEVLVADVRCLGCEYNLRGLARDARCPECGASVASTLQNALMFCDPKWLQQVTRGLTLVLAGTGMGVLVLLVWVPVSMRILARDYLPIDVNKVFGVLLIVASIVSAIGLLVATQRERPRRMSERRPGWRRATRILASSAIGFVLPDVLDSSSFTRVTLELYLFTWNSLLLLAALVIAAIGLVVATRRERAHRIAARNWSWRRATRLLAGSAIGFLLVILLTKTRMYWATVLRFPPELLACYSGFVALVVYLDRLSRRVPANTHGTRFAAIMIPAPSLLIIGQLARRFWIIPWRAWFIGYLSMTLLVILVLMPMFLLHLFRCRRALRRIQPTCIPPEAAFGSAVLATPPDRRHARANQPGAPGNDRA